MCRALGMQRQQGRSPLLRGGQEKAPEDEGRGADWGGQEVQVRRGCLGKAGSKEDRKIPLAQAKGH